MEETKQPEWQATALRKRAERQSRLPLKWLVPEDELPSSEITDVTGLSEKKGWINQREADITSLDMVALAAAIKERQYSSVEVVEGFAHRATIAQQLVNA
jgi:amidase